MNGLFERPRRNPAVAEPPMRLIVIATVLGIIVGAFIAPQPTTDFADGADSAASVLSAQDPAYTRP